MGSLYELIIIRGENHASLLFLRTADTTETSKLYEIVTAL